MRVGNSLMFLNNVHSKAKRTLLHAETTVATRLLFERMEQNALRLTKLYYRYRLYSSMLGNRKIGVWKTRHNKFVDNMKKNGSHNNR